MNIAVVTGASSGMGREFVRQLSQYITPDEIWVIARREDALLSLRQEVSKMSDEFGPTFITVTADDGEELTLEFIAALELDGTEYHAFFPTSEEDSEEEDPDEGLIILKVIHENGEELLSTCDSDEEIEKAYEAFMAELFADGEDGEIL